MRKKTLLSSSLTLVLVVVLLSFRSVATAGYFDWSALKADAVAESTVDVDNSNLNSAQRKQDNGFVRALGAPFRAISRLFGGGNKNDHRAHRTTEKDAVKFESTRTTRIKDSQIEPLAATSSASNSNNIAAPSTSSSNAMSSGNTAATATNAALTLRFKSNLQTGRERLVVGDIDRAIAELSGAASINPKSAEVNNLLGIAYESKGLREHALRCFEVAIHADETNAEYLNNLGFLLYKSGDYERATKYLKRAVKLSPKDARIWNNLAVTQCQRAKFDDAYESFVKAVGEFDGHLKLAAQLQMRGYGKDAIMHLEKAQAIRPNSVEVLTKLVALYDMTGRPTDAESARRSLVALKTFADVNE